MSANEPQPPPPPPSTPPTPAPGQPPAAGSGGRALLPLPSAGIFEVRNITERSTGKNCTVTTTPQPCPAGSFCPQNSTAAFPCPPGFWCPPQTAFPDYCCEGFFCEAPDRMALCPAGSFCPKGSTQPVSCNLLGVCPAGTAKVFRIGVFGIYAVYAAAAAALFWATRKCRASRAKRKAFAMRPEGKDVGGILSRAPSADDEEGGSGPHTLIQDFQFEGLTKVLRCGKVVMRGVSGQLRPGRVCAVMGPSGSGKTTLVSLLCGKVRRSAGQILINGREDELFRLAKLVGYVPQDDTMLRDLRVVDILRHSARVRLPRDWSAERKKQKVDEIMRYLALDGVATSVVGDERKRGISGGQRKRVNIAMELVAEPSVLFLDEPTSGLDSSTANQLSGLLRKIALDMDIIVAAIIHSPSQQSFDMFDDLLLLGNGGRLVYAGPRAYAREYFERMDFVREHALTEPEFFMDVVSGKAELPGIAAFRAARDLPAFWTAFQAGKPADHAAMLEICERAARDEEIQERQQGGHGHGAAARARPAGIVAAAKEYLADLRDETATALSAIGRKDEVRVTPTWPQVFSLCAKRAWKQIWQSWTQFMIEMNLHFAAGIFISVAAQNLDYFGKFPDALCLATPFPVVRNCVAPENNLPQVGVFMALGIFFSGISIGANTFGREMEVYWRDVAAGMPTLPYFAAKVLVDVPRIVAAGSVFSVAMLFAWPFRGSLIFTFVTVVAMYYVAFAFGYLISTLARRETIGMLASAFALLWALVLGGVVPKLADVNNPANVFSSFRLLWDVSAPRYAVEAFFVAESNTRPWDELKNGTDIFDALGYRRNGFAPAVLNVFVIGTVWMLVAAIMLKLTNRDKQR